MLSWRSLQQALGQTKRGGTVAQNSEEVRLFARPRRRLCRLARSVAATNVRTGVRRATDAVLFHKFCHQYHPHGEAGLGPAINSNPAPMAAFRAQVRAGLGAMPAFPDAVLPSRDLDQLLAFVSAQRKQRD